MKPIALAIAALALASCATVPAVPVTTGTPTAALGQTAVVGPLLVRPVAIVEDSRCPINAICVWAGRLVVRAEITLSGGSEQLDMPLTLGQPIAVDGGQLSLVSALPGKMADQPARPSDYRFTFEYRRK